MMVIKRDGSKVDFNADKIKNAVSKAYKEVYPDLTPSLADNYGEEIKHRIILKISDTPEILIETIQDMVEKELMDIDKDVAKA